MPQSLADLSLHTLTSGSFHPSPIAWEDQVLYFLLVDRFSDGKEKGYRDKDGNAVTVGTTPTFTNSDRNNAIQNDADAQKWREAGGKFCGGTLKGLQSKIGYLKRMGVTAIWISPVLK